MGEIKKLNQSGLVNTWLIAFIITLVVFLASAGFGLWAYSGMQSYKNDVDAKIAEASAAAVKKNSEDKEKEFTEKEKQPYKTYTGPASYASVAITYPKNWSAYVDDSGKSSVPLDAIFNPNYVPGLQSSGNVAVHLQVVNNQYSQAIKTFDAFVKGGKTKASPYKLAKVSSATAIRLDGDLPGAKKGSMVVVQVRDKTLEIWTEGDANLNDFNNIILPNLSYIP